MYLGKQKISIRYYYLSFVKKLIRALLKRRISKITQFLVHNIVTVIWLTAILFPLLLCFLLEYVLCRNMNFRSPFQQENWAWIPLIIIILSDKKWIKLICRRWNFLYNNTTIFWDKINKLWILIFHECQILFLFLTW